MGATRSGLRAATWLLLEADTVCVTPRRYQRALETRYRARNALHSPLGAATPLERLAYPAAGPPEGILFFGVVVPPYTATTGASSVLRRSAALGRPVVASDLPDLRADAEEAGCG